MCLIRKAITSGTSLSLNDNITILNTRRNKAF